MSNKILTFKELETGESYKFLGRTGEYPSNKLVKTSLFSHLHDIMYVGTSSWYLGMGETVNNATIYSNTTRHRFDLPDQYPYHAANHFKIIQEDLTKTGINNSYVWKEHDANLTSVAPYYRHEFYYNLAQNDDDITLLNEDFPIMADTLVAPSNYYGDNYFSSQYRSNLLGGITDYALTSLYDSIIDHYIIPSCVDDPGNTYLNFFDSKSGNGTGYMDIYLGDERGLSLFAQYSYYDYYVKGTYNTNPCVFYCRMRYFGNPTLQTIVNPISIPGDRYNYGTQGSIFGNQTLDKIYNTPPIGYIYPAWYETVDGDWDNSFNLEFVRSTDLPYIEDRDGKIYERLKAPSTSLTPSGSLTVSGSTLPVYDIRHHFIDGYLSDGYEFNSGGGGGNNPSTPDGDLTSQYFKFVNFTTEDIHVYRVWNANNGNNDAPEFIYAGTAANNEGLLKIQLYQEEIDNPDNYGFAFTTADSIYNRNAATIVTIDGYTYESGYWEIKNGEYMFESYDVGVSIPGLPLYDEDLFVEQPTMWMSITDIQDRITFSYANEDGYIGLSHLNGRMYRDLDMQPYDDSGACTAYLYDEPELYGAYSVISEAITDGYLSGMDDYEYGYVNSFAVSFDVGVELYYKIPGYGYYRIPVNRDGDLYLGSDIHIRIDPIRGAAMSYAGAQLCQGVYIDSNLYVKVS